MQPNSVMKIPPLIMITLVCSVTYFLYKKDFAKIAKSFKIKNYLVAARPLTRSLTISDIFCALSGAEASINVSLFKV